MADQPAGKPAGKPADLIRALLPPNLCLNCFRLMPPGRAVDDCTCKPFTVVHFDSSSDELLSMEIWEDDAASAAQAYAEYYNESDPSEPMMNGNNPIEVAVDGKTFSVEAYVSTEYRAEEIKHPVEPDSQTN